ncbi:MAG: hypothetical protein HYV90_03915 [Candidatus Woesebacteria bacterium]|nr:MAG: hypothetical protein HYV90_03915 [Candidatus Woesebacteria bacterium]
MSETNPEFIANENANQELAWPMDTDNPNYHFFRRLERVILDFKTEKPEEAQILLDSQDFKVSVVGGVADPERVSSPRKDLDLRASGIDPDILDESAFALSDFSDFINSSNQELPDRTSDVFHMMQIKDEPSFLSIDITPQVKLLLSGKRHHTETMTKNLDQAESSNDTPPGADISLPESPPENDPEAPWDLPKGADAGLPNEPRPKTNGKKVPGDLPPGAEI